MVKVICYLTNCCENNQPRMREMLQTHSKQHWLPSYTHICTHVDLQADQRKEYKQKYYMSLVFIVQSRANTWAAQPPQRNVLLDADVLVGCICFGFPLRCLCHVVIWCYKHQNSSMLNELTMWESNMRRFTTQSEFKLRFMKLQGSSSTCFRLVE